MLLAEVLICAGEKKKRVIVQGLDNNIQLFFSSEHSARGIEPFNRIYQKTEPSLIHFYLINVNRCRKNGLYHYYSRSTGRIILFHGNNLALDHGRSQQANDASKKEVYS